MFGRGYQINRFIGTPQTGDRPKDEPVAGVVEVGGSQEFQRLIQGGLIQEAGPKHRLLGFEAVR